MYILIFFTCFGIFLLVAYINDLRKTNEKFRSKSLKLENELELASRKAINLKHHLEQSQLDLIEMDKLLKIRTEESKSKFTEFEKRLRNDLEQKEAIYDSRMEQRENALKLDTSQLQNTKKNINANIEQYLFSKTKAFPWLAGMIADFLTITEEEYIKDLLGTGSNSKIERALKITDLKNDKRELISKNKMLEYELAYIKSLYPNLENLIEFDCISNELTIENEICNTIPRDDFLKLSSYEKNVLALDYYKHKSKSNWEIGRDYELSVGYRLEKRGLKVTYYGIEKKLDDLGRDLIAENTKQVFIIQCKYWSKEKVIHEKHITQLYGTFIKYRLENKSDQRKMVPLLITHTDLSDTAKEFAEALGVKVFSNFKMIEYPLIKCKNNRNEKGFKTMIYHLPIDLQYDNTIIKRENGDFMAFTIDEAENAGYRRAYKWRNKE